MSVNKVSMYVCMSVCMLCMYVCVCVCMSLSIYLYVQTDRTIADVLGTREI